MGAPHDIVDSAARGTMPAPVAIPTIGSFLFAVGMCAWSAAGNVRPLPLTRPWVYLTARVLILRAVALPL